LFLLTKTTKEIFRCCEGLYFEVMDYDAVGGDESLGVTYVLPSVLYDGSGERLEFDLKPKYRSKHPGKV